MRTINSCLKFLIIFSLINWFVPFARAEEKIVAIVNNEIITQRDLEAFLNFMKIQLSKEFSARELEEKIAVMRADLLDRLIEDRLILQEAKRNNFKADEARIKAKIDELKKRYDSETDFENSLKNQGLVEADLEARVRDQILMYNIVETKIRNKISIKPAEITEYYNKNASEFSLPEEREFQSLSGADESGARKAVEGLKQGKDMKTVAQETTFSLNNFSARKDGELKKDVEEVLFNLKSGDVSEPIKIKDNYYVFQLVKIKPERQQVLSEVQDAIHATIYEKKMQEAMAKWVEELKKKAYLKKI